MYDANTQARVWVLYASAGLTLMGVGQNKGPTKSKVPILGADGKQISLPSKSSKNRGVMEPAFYGWNHPSGFVPPRPGGAAGWGVLQGHAVIDVDIKGGKDGMASIAKLSADCGTDLLALASTKTQSGGYHIYLKGIPLHMVARWLKNHPRYPGIDFLTGLSDKQMAQALLDASLPENGGEPRIYRNQVVAAGSNLGQGCYELIGDKLQVTECSDKLLDILFRDERVERAQPTLTAVPAQASGSGIDGFTSESAKLVAGTPVAGAPSAPAPLAPSASAPTTPTMDAIRFYLSKIPQASRGFDYDQRADWVRCGHMLARHCADQGIDQAKGHDCFQVWASRSTATGSDGQPMYDQNACTAQYNECISSYASRGGGVTINSLMEFVSADMRRIHKQITKLDADATTIPAPGKSATKDERDNALLAACLAETTVRPGSTLSLCDLVSVNWFKPSDSGSSKSDIVISELKPEGITKGRLTELARERRWVHVWQKTFETKTDPSEGAFWNFLIDIGKTDSEVSGITMQAWNEEQIIEGRRGEGKVVNVYPHRALRAIHEDGIDMLRQDTDDDKRWLMRVKAYLAFLENHFHWLAGGSGELVNGLYPVHDENGVAHLPQYGLDGHCAYYWFIRGMLPIKPLKVALMVTGTMGVGKSAICDLACALLGDNRAVSVRIELLFGRFNDFQVGRQFIVGEELRKEGKSGGDIEKQLRDFITGKQVMVEAKGQTAYPYKPCHSLMLISNDNRVIALTTGDRRYVVITSQDDLPAFERKAIAGARLAVAYSKEGRELGLESIPMFNNDDYWNYLHYPMEGGADGEELGRRVQAYLYTLDVQHGGKRGDYSGWHELFPAAFNKAGKAYRTEAFAVLQPSSRTAGDDWTVAFDSVIADNHPLANSILVDAVFLYEQTARERSLPVDVRSREYSDGVYRTISFLKLRGYTSDKWEVSRDVLDNGTTRRNKVTRYVNDKLLKPLKEAKETALLYQSWRDAYRAHHNATIVSDYDGGEGEGGSDA